jgi:hypothetical protein
MPPARKIFISDGTPVQLIISDMTNIFSDIYHFLHKNNSLSADWTNGNPPSSKMRRTLSLIFCAPYVIISGKCPDINIYSSKSSQNGHDCLDDDILVSGFS